MNRPWPILFSVVTAAVSVLVTKDAAAFNTGSCGGAPMRWWIGGGLGVHRNATSMAAGGNRERAMANALAQWNRVAPNVIYEQGTTTGTVDFNDYRRDIIVVNANDPILWTGTVYALGATAIQWSGCTITKADVALSNGMTFAPPADSRPVGSGPGFSQDPGWHVTLHEFGHLLGLSNKWSSSVDQHSTFFAIMRASPPYPTFGAFPDPIQASPAAPAPDDAAGMRFLYFWEFGGEPPTRNVTSTQSVLSGGTIKRLLLQFPGEPFLNVCRGDTVNIGWSVANTGNQQVTINHRIYMRSVNDPNPYNAFGPGAILVTQWNGSIHNPYNQLTVPFTATIPCGTASGVYFLLHFTDSGFQVSEYNEYDNTSAYAMIVVVNNCGC